MKLRPDGHDPFEPPPQYGRSLQGLTLNLLSADLDRVAFLGIEIQEDRWVTLF